MERIFTPGISRVRRTGLHTTLRIALTGFLLWSFFTGSSSLSFGLVAMLGIVNALALLLVYELVIRDISPARTTMAVFALICVCLGGYGLWWATRPPLPTGPLLPANEPLADAACREKPGATDLVMALGRNRVVGKGRGPFFPLQAGDCTIMAARRSGTGLLVKAFFYDWTNDVAFSVVDNVYDAKLPLQLRSFRPDPHTLVILDRYDKEVFYLRYLNPNAVRIRGRFLCGETPQVIIGDDRILTGGVRLNGVYVGQHPARGARCAVLRGREPGIVITGR